MVIQKIYIGGWFQRTTLHLTEVWDFIKYKKSRLDFTESDLDKFYDLLGVSAASREGGPLEYVEVKTFAGISYRVYEDGLIILEKDFSDLKNDFEAIKEYYDTRLSPAISFIFSKGAPVPKELANIKNVLPYIVTVSGAEDGEIKKVFNDFSEEIYSVVSTEGIGAYRSAGIIFINNLLDAELARIIIESEIFFREFKSQLHRYLMIHRIIWEKIAQIKERGDIKGTEVDNLRNELSDYQKTINLIGSRIDQMSPYVRTRQKITEREKIDENLKSLFQFKFETLLDTHEYIKHLWGMTKNYLASAIEIFSELQQKSTKNTISSLQLITTIGVVAGIFGYLGKEALPSFTAIGLVYFAILLLLTWLINNLISRIYKSKKYTTKSPEIVKEIK